MNILIVSPGEASFVVREGKGYCANGAKVRLLVPHIPGRKTKELLMPDYEVFRVRYFWPEQAQILFHPVDNFYMNFGLKKALLSLLFIPRFLWAVTLHARRFEIIHCQWSTSILFALPSKWLWGCKLVVTVRGTDLRDFPHWLNRFILKNADLAIDGYEGSFLMNSIRKRFPANWIGLPQLYEPLKFQIETLRAALIQFHLYTNKKLNVVYVGRLDKEKAETFNLPIFQLLHALKTAKESGWSFSLVYLGGGELLNELKNLAINLEIERDVLFCGHVGNPESYLDFFDVGVGGASINAVAQEFAMAGLAQIQPEFSADYPKGEPFWENGSNVFYFNPNNIVTLENTLKELFDNPTIRIAVGKASMLRIANNAMDYIQGGKVYIKAFEKII